MAQRDMAKTITTGEGVALDVVMAGPGLRVLSGLIDLVLSAVVLIVVAVSWFERLIRGIEASDQVFFLLILIVVMFAGPVLIETATGGKSIGRYIVGTRVVRADMRREHMSQAAIRALLALVEIWGTFGAIAMISVFVDGKNRRIGDLAAGTIVINDRVKFHAIENATGRVNQVLNMSEGNAPARPFWIQQADLRRLPPDLSSAARSFMIRRGYFDPASRERLGAELAGELRNYVFPLPPPEVSNEAFIEAVLVERARREAERMRNNQRLARSVLR